MAAPLQILPVRAPGDERPKWLHEWLPTPPCTICIFGGTASGKSTVVANLCLNSKFYRRAWDNCYLFSPTADLDPSIAPVTKWARSTGGVWHELDEEALRAVIADAEERKEAGEKVRDVIILDDLAGELSPAVGWLATRARHYGLSLVVISQVARAFPHQLRCNAHLWLNFVVHNHKEQQKVNDELAGSFPGYAEAVARCTSQKFGFLTADIKGRRLTDSFKELIREF